MASNPHLVDVEELYMLVTTKLMGGWVGTCLLQFLKVYDLFKLPVKEVYLYA
jgi:hypothetical protein